MLARLKAALRRGEPFEGEAVNHRKDGSAWDVCWNITPVRDGAGRITAWTSLQRDITEQRRARGALERTEAWLRVLLEGLPQLVWRAVDGGEWTWASPQWERLTGLSSARSEGWGWLDALHPADREAARAAWRATGPGHSLDAEYRIYSVPDGRHRAFKSRATAVRDRDGALVEWLGTSTDVDDLQRLRSEQAALLAELQHRVRNALAQIRTVVERTSRTSDTVEAYHAHLTGRLAVLARIQAAVTRAAGQRFDLDEMVREELLAQHADESRVEIEGPRVELPSTSAELIALALHELAVNAVKYGALGHAGRLSVRWSVAAGRLHLEWRETGVRVISGAPRREGFGAELITRRLRYELDAATELLFAPGGVVCRLDFPLSATPDPPFAPD